MVPRTTLLDYLLILHTYFSTPKQLQLIAERGALSARGDVRESEIQV